ncbi:MAG: hypothetical protein PHO15_06125 [Eubacteriales bacterium]|nr:hypothetical protein [Eubacteriales bacterium]
MSQVTVYPGQANGVIAAPPSVGEGLRALVTAALTQKSVHGAGGSADVLTMLGGLKALGAACRQEGETIVFYRPPAPCEARIGCGRSRDAFCFLLALCLGMGGRYTFVVEAPDKEMAGIQLFLKQQEIDYSVSGTRLYICGKIKSKKIEISGNIMPELVSGLLLALPLMDGAAVRAPDDAYLRLTRDIMARYGQIISPAPEYSLTERRDVPIDCGCRIGGDCGIASYYLLAGLMSGRVGVTGLLYDSVQPERRAVALLKEKTSGIEDLNGAVFAKKSRIACFDADAQEFAAAVPMLIAMFCGGSGKCVIKNADKLQNRDKAAVTGAVRAFGGIGADIARHGGDIAIEGRKKLFGGASGSFGDARIAMALAVAALRCETAVTIDDAGAVSAVAPDFFRKLSALGILIQ